MVAMGHRGYSNHPGWSLRTIRRDLGARGLDTTRQAPGGGQSQGGAHAAKGRQSQKSDSNYCALESPARASLGAPEGQAGKPKWQQLPEDTPWSKG
jgi:hypothetical protein